MSDELKIIQNISFNTMTQALFAFSRFLKYKFLRNTS